LAIIASDDGAIEDGAIVVGIMLGADELEESSLLPQAASEIEKMVAAATAVSLVARMVRSSSLGTFTLDSGRTVERMGRTSS
jgi:hypothetical protein